MLAIRSIVYVNVSFSFYFAEEFMAKNAAITFMNGNLQYN